jgi:hypothetical protein
MLTLLCRDRPKMGDSMICHNFAHRIAQIWVISMVCFGNLSILARKKFKNHDNKHVEPLSDVGAKNALASLT